MSNTKIQMWQERRILQKSTAAALEQGLRDLLLFTSNTTSQIQQTCTEVQPAEPDMISIG